MEAFPCYVVAWNPFKIILIHVINRHLQESPGNKTNHWIEGSRIFAAIHVIDRRHGLIGRYHVFLLNPLCRLFEIITVNMF